jgi:hypothetical protein
MLICRRYDAYIKAAEQITIAQGIITDKDSAAATIDRVLTECLTRVRLIAFRKLSFCSLCNVGSPRLPNSSNESRLHEDLA